MNVFCIADGTLTIIGSIETAEVVWLCQCCSQPAMLTDIGIFCARCEEQERDYIELKEQCDGSEDVPRR